MEVETQPLIPKVEEGSTEGSQPPWLHVSVRFFYPIVILLILGFAVSGVFVDKYFGLDLSTLEILDSAGSRLSHRAPIATLSAGTITIEDTRGPPTKYEYGSDELNFNDDFFKRFDNELVSMDYVMKSLTTVKVFGFIYSGLSLAALVLQLVYRETPSTMMFKTGSNFADNWKGALPVWLLLVSAIFGVLSLLLATSVSQPLATRFALRATRLNLSPQEWTKFCEQLDAPQPRLFLLKTLRVMGHWFMKAGAEWMFSSYCIMTVIGLCMSVFVFAFFMDSQLVRFRMGLDTMIIRDRIKQELARLPRHCRVLPIWVPIAAFVLMNGITKFCGRSANNRGRWLNRFLWTSPEVVPQNRLIDDLIVSKTNFLYFQPPTIIDGAVLIWVPLLLTIVLGSIERISFLSKFLEIITIAYLGRCFSIMATIMPSAMTLLQRPVCYDDTRMTVWESFKTSNFCNDMVYSGHATLTMVPGMALLLMIIYGPFRSKLILLTSVALGMAISLSIVVVGRFHFTADVLISAIVCFFAALVHAPALKVFYSYHRYEQDKGALAGIGRMAGEIERASDTVETVLKSTKVDHDSTNWKTIEEKQEVIRQLLEKLLSTINS
jgi:hypothetical protein